MSLVFGDEFVAEGLQSLTSDERGAFVTLYQLVMGSITKDDVQIF